MVDPKQIIKGEISYTLDQVAADVRARVEHICKQCDQQVNTDAIFKNALLVVMFLAEERSIEEIMSIMQMSEQAITLTADLFKEEVEIARAVHMALILQIMQEYLLNPIQTLPLVNKRIQQFLKRYIP